MSLRADRRRKIFEIPSKSSACREARSIGMHILIIRAWQIQKIKLGEYVKT